MTEEEIIDAISKIDGINRMTINERLYESGLKAEFDKAKWDDRPKAKKILELLSVDQASINKIVKPTSTRKQIIYLTILLMYLFFITQTEFSLTGFWSDVIFSIVFSLVTLKIVFSNKAYNKILTYLLRTLSLMSTVAIFGFYVATLDNPFIIDTFKLRTFYFQSVDNRLFNAYFKPVGAYSGGYGNFWITEIPKFFPILEKQVFYDRTVHYDFNADNWDGEPTDNSKVVKEYIKDEVINKHAE